MKRISIYPLSEHRKRLQAKEAAAVARALNVHTEQEIEELPDLPTDRVEWEYFCRALIKGTKNRLKYRPMLLKIVNDIFPFIMLMLARQWGKTTMIASNLAFHATTKHHFDQMYFNFKEPNLKTFTENKFREDVFGQGPLSKYVAGISRLGSQRRILSKTKSAIDMMLPGMLWENALGGSNQRLEIDEGQDHDWTGFGNVRETQADTMGDLEIAGVGGFKDTDYDRLWKSTNQMQYKFKRSEPWKGYENMSWRNDLEFDDEGLVEGAYLLDVLDGEYIADVPRNYSRHGYHLSQLQNPRIPLKIEHAINDYKVSPEFSIEWKEKKDPNYSFADYVRNILAESVEGELKPITSEMILNLFDKTMGLTKAADVDHAAGQVFIGIDWGGGGKTIIWIWQCIDNTAPIFKLLWVEQVMTSDVQEQIRICKNLCDAYEPKKIIVDAGGGTEQVQSLQKYYGSTCIRNSYHPRPELALPTRVELVKFNREMRYVIDRTFSINRIISLIKYPHKEPGFTCNRIILPGKDYEEVKWIVKQFTALVGTKEHLKSTGQTYIKYDHKDSEPDDALQACNYAFIAWDIGRGAKRIKFSQFKDKDPFKDGYSASPPS
ncbi:hypothetical protein LCGC14_0380410 [marine sediment metagenome]|uniref:Terminase large subunit gp17-like C-terminal domain-containing protein n=1 Tax=marine sediment metagenome TaxID=412755 RepID=A0A0F9T284_9ZZZZ